MDKPVPQKRQAALGFIFATLLMSVSAIFGPLLMAKAFYYFTKPNPFFQFPGMPFVIGSALMLLSAWLAVRVLKENNASI